MGLLSYVIEHDASNNVVANSVIRLLIWMFAVTISSYFMWRSCEEIIKIPVTYSMLEDLIVGSTLAEILISNFQF